MLVVRRYVPQDLDKVIEVFLESIRQTASVDYEPEQISAWAQADPTGWSQRCASRPTWVAVIDDAVAGFTEFEHDGHLDMMYVHPRFKRLGVAKALLQAVEGYARRVSVARVYTEASITARPFFERHGFRLVEHERVLRNGQYFDRFRMDKHILDSTC